MRNNKLVYIIIILGLFVIFLLFQCFKPHKYVVIKVNSPTSVVVDKNNNGLADDGEEIELLNGYKVLTKQNFHNKYWKDLKLDDYSKLALMYLSEKFAADLLTDKKVQFTDSDKELIVSGDKYTNIMVKSGYLFKDGQPVNKKAYSKRMAQISKNEYKLYNAKSGKYHLLSCKYGQKAHKYVLIAKYQIPKGASPCQYCLGDKNKIKHKKKIKCENKRVHPSFTNLIFTDGSIKVILNDYTTHLRPDRHCTTNMAKEILNQINKAQKSIDIAIYGYDRVPPIENAIKRAKARGVKVRLVYDTDSKGNNIYRNTQEFASFIGNSVCDKANSACNSPGIYTNSKMHDKFYIFDNSVVITGSANLSHTDMSDYNSNCLLIINSNKVAEVYTKEFDQMYNSNFHNLKQQISDKENIKIGNSLLSVYFSPKDTIIK